VIDLGTVTYVDEPNGVSWLTFPALRLTNHPLKSNGEDFDIVPIASEVLVAKKGGELVVEDMFGVDVNLDALSPADVAPEVQRYVEPATEEALRSFYVR